MKINLWNKKEPIFEGLLDNIYQTHDFCDVYYIADQGFCVLNHEPKYGFYKRLGIPEIQNVYVMPNARRRGVATSLIRHCESLCTKDMIGISVSIAPQFGVAQRLYARLGYVPDGNGITYDREPLRHGDRAIIDDDLCLMLIKELQS